MVEVGHLSNDALLLAANSTVSEDTSFAFSINKKPPRAYSDFLDRAGNYINGKALTLKKSGTVKTFQENPEGERCKEMKRLIEGTTGSIRQAHKEKRPRDSGPGLRAVRARKPRYDRYQ